MKILALFLAAVLLLSGCTPGAQPPVGTTAKESTAQTTQSPATTATQPPVTTVTAMTTVTPTTAKPTVSPTQNSTIVPTVAPTSAPTIAPTAAPTVAPPVAPTVAPTVAATTATPTTASSARPVSSAICKDTGSDAVWLDPYPRYELDAYEESDPERLAYRQFLQKEGNEFFYWIQDEDEYIHMYMGRNYGIPLYTSEEYMLASIWTSSDPAVATVNPYGFVTPVAEGRAVITVSLNGCIRQCAVEVEKEPAKPVTFAEFEQRAHEEAQKIAEFAMSSQFADTDLERIGLAASVVYTQYVRKFKGIYIYDLENGMQEPTRIPGYNQPFGTLVTYYSSCAGNTRAMGLVLEYMGFQWYHVNADREDHQWCVVYDVDGKTAFADAAIGGIVGYGGRETEEWLCYANGNLVPFKS